jgi:hypothetical protein
MFSRLRRFHHGPQEVPHAHEGPIVLDGLDVSRAP